jgi:CopG family nickel-responsive transcriptional regulator
MNIKISIKGGTDMRIAMTIPKELVNKFDECLKKNGYNSRTKGLQDAMQEYMELHK